MQFNSLGSMKAMSRAAPAPTGPVSEISKNLLKHIPGEASGFYLIAAGSFQDPGIGTLGALFAMSLFIVLLVRILAKASIGIIATTVGAFLIWMLVIDNGFLAQVLPDVLPDPWGLILALFYSIVITALASAGKLR